MRTGTCHVCGCQFERTNRNGAKVYCSYACYRISDNEKKRAITRLNNEKKRNRLACTAREIANYASINQLHYGDVQAMIARGELSRMAINERMKQLTDDEIRELSGHRRSISKPVNIR